MTPPQCPEPAGACCFRRVSRRACGLPTSAAAGAVTRMLAEMTGPSGSVTGIDVNEAQIETSARDLPKLPGEPSTRSGAATCCSTSPIPPPLCAK